MSFAFVQKAIGGIVANTRTALSIRANIDAASNALRLFWRHRSLAIELTRRDLMSQHAGQALGFLWVIGHPLILLLVYIFVFVVVFKVRLAATVDIPRDYTVYILSGLVPWLAIVQSLARGSNALLGQSNLVRQVVFPVEILPLGAVLVSMTAEVVGLVIITLYCLVKFGSLPWTFLLLPLAIVLQFLLMTGLAFVFAALTPFLRDLKELVTVFSVVGVFMIPAFYLPEWITGYAKLIIYANPFSYVIWMFQDIFYFGSIAHPYAWAVVAIMSVVAFTVGFRTFSAVKPYIANVL